MKNIILVDYGVDETWDFKQGLEKSTKMEWELGIHVTNRLHGSLAKEIIRYFEYFKYSFCIFLKRKSYAQVFAWQQFYGLLLAFFCLLFHVKDCPPIYVMTFIYKEKNKLYFHFIKKIISSKYIKKLFVLSDSEIEYYSNLFNVDYSKFISTRIGVPDVTEKIMINPSREKYYLSVGRSNRDYGFLSKCWKEEYGKLIIICDSYNQPPKSNIQVMSNCYGDEYLTILANCYAQIIILEDPNISSGSLSFLQAMMCSRPTIVSDNKTVSDYITDKKDGIIIKKTEKDFAQALAYIEEEKYYEMLCNNARNTYLNRFSEFSLGVDIGKSLSDVFK